MPEYTEWALAAVVAVVTAPDVPIDDSSFLYTGCVW